MCFFSYIGIRNCYNGKEFIYHKEYLGKMWKIIFKFLHKLIVLDKDKLFTIIYLIINNVARKHIFLSQKLWLLLFI